MPDRNDYAYAVARIRAIEGRLLDRARLERMVEAKTADEAFKVLQEAGYGYYSGGSFNTDDYEEVLKQEEDKTFRLLMEVSPYPEAFDIFLYKIDYHNMKFLIKAEFLGQLEEGGLINEGTIPPSGLRSALAERTLEVLPEVMEKAVETAIDTFNRTSDPQTIDILLDLALYSQLAESARRLGESFIIELVGIMADLSNIGTYLRVRNMNKSREFFQRVLLPGGRLSGDLFPRQAHENVEGFMNAVRYTVYGKLCEEAVTSYSSSGSLTAFERLSDNYLIGYIKKAKYITLGIEPLVAYLMAKQFEIKNARIVMVGKINGIPDDIIRERLRDTYV